MIKDMNRPDFSNFLAHFTKDSELSANDESNPVWSYYERTREAHINS